MNQKGLLNPKLGDLKLSGLRAGGKKLFSPNLILFGVVVWLVGMTLFKSFYTVAADETGLLLRFGKWTGEPVQPGIHLKLPYIDTIDKVPTKRVLKEEFGFRTVSAGVRTVYSDKDFQIESLTLTGDLNVSDVEWIVQYQIEDPFKAVFNIRDLRAALRDLSESAVRQVLGSVTVDAILTTERNALAERSKTLLQAAVDKLDIGLRITTFRYQNATPPEPVKPAYNEVNQAEQIRESLIFNARKEYNEQVPRARGEAMQTIQEAEGYAAERVNHAIGNAARFNAILAEYRKAPQVTRYRMYVETMEKVLPQASEVYVMDGAQTAPLTHLPLRATTLPAVSGSK